MRRAQIQFTSDQLATLRRLSAEQQRSIADIVRESLDLYLRARLGRDREALVDRAKRAAGKYASGASDVSSRHDAYLADAFR